MFFLWTPLSGCCFFSGVVLILSVNSCGFECEQKEEVKAFFLTAQGTQFRLFVGIKEAYFMDHTMALKE